MLVRSDTNKKKHIMRMRRQRRIRSKIHGTKERPRLSVFRSSKRVALQLINDETGRTLVSASSTFGKKGKVMKTEFARSAGRELAQKALKTGIKRVVFDRGGYAYHGRVRAVAEGAREGGLEF